MNKEQLIKELNQFTKDKIIEAIADTDSILTNRILTKLMKTKGKRKTYNDYVKQYESSGKEMPLECYIAYEYLKDNGFNKTITMETMYSIDHEEPRLHDAIINGLYDLIYVYGLAKRG